MEPLVRLDGISKFYPGVTALSEVSFDIQCGEVQALVGENGAGKSTLIKILAGVIQPDEGELFIDGESKNFSHPLESMRTGVAVTYQDLSLFPNLTVAENIAIALSLEKNNKIIDWKNIRKTAREALKNLDERIDINMRLRHLSIGNQNLVAIARAIAHSAKILILDEPTASLAHEEVKSLFRIINMLKKQGMGILFVSHRLDEVFNISDRTTILRDGHYVGTYQTDSLKEEELISAMVGRKIHFTRYEHRNGGDTILKVDHLGKANNFLDISFRLQKGEILGITGLVGAGRTELAQALFGNNSPDSGEIYLHGQKLDLKSTEDAMKRGIAYIPESRHTQGLILGKTLTDNIVATILNRLVNRFKIIDRKKQRETVNTWIKKLNIKPAFPDMLIDQFSGGNQQKAVIAKWLAYKPVLLIVDEPTHGIDIGAKSEIHKLLRDLSEEGIGIIMISSELPEILAVSDRILVMRRGRLVGEFSSESVDQEKIMNLALKG